MGEKTSKSKESTIRQKVTRNPVTNRRLRCSKESVAQALLDSRGIASVAARKLGVSRKSIFDYMDRWPELHEVRDEARNVISDKAEDNIVKAVNEGDLKTSRWWLQHQARDRGYGERLELKHDGEIEIRLEMGTELAKEA